MRRPAALLLVCLAGCAFPPSCGGGDIGDPLPPECASDCAGSCESGVCVASPEGGPCDPTVAGPECVEGTSCLSGACVADEEPAHAPVALDDYLATKRSDFCAFLVRCDEWPAELLPRCGEALVPDRPTFGTDAESVALARAGEATYDAQAAGDCLGGLDSRDCRDGLPEACGRIFLGAGAVGAVCGGDAACGAGLFCERDDPTGLSCTGSCSVAAGEGESCDARPCGSGLVCAHDVCAKVSGPGGANDACGAGMPCGRGLYCAPTGRCALLHQAKDACDDARGCADGLVCARNGPGATCLARSRRGEACSSNDQCAPMTLLVAADHCEDGVCTALPGDGPCLGGACDPTSAFCRDGSCGAFTAEGEPCATDAECGAPFADDICSFGVCARPLACGS